MKPHRLSFAALALALLASPAFAGGTSFDLPRLDFPTATPDGTRACPLPPVPLAPEPCAGRRG